MLKRGLALLLALVMLASVSVAGAAWSEVKVDGHHKYVSVADWSKADIEKAIKLNLDVAYTGENVQMSIARVDFAEDAAALVGLAYGQDIRTYERYNELQVLLNKAEKKDVWREMGILKGRGNGYYVDPNTPITRQEAAVVLARVYRLYAEEPQTKTPLTYQDAKDVADWAKDDVALMTQLGVMNGVAKGKFDPKGQYTVEQCLVTLVRLYEKTAQGKTPVGTYPLQLGQRETVIGQTWQGYELYGYAEKAGVTVIAANEGGGQPGNWQITVIDKNDQGKVYRNVIKRKYSASSAYDAPLERMTLSADGSQVIYQSTLETDAVDKTGKVPVPQGPLHCDDRCGEGRADLRPRRPARNHGGDCPGRQQVYCFRWSKTGGRERLGPGADGVCTQQKLPETGPAGPVCQQCAEDRWPGLWRGCQHVCGLSGTSGDDRGERADPIDD